VNKKNAVRPRPEPGADGSVEKKKNDRQAKKAKIMQKRVLFTKWDPVSEQPYERTSTLE